MGYCPSGRLFEAAACAAPVLTDLWDGLGDFFDPGSEILVAASGEDVTAALQAPDRDLVSMGQAARDRVLAEHTADRRALQFVTAVEGALSVEA